MLNGKTLADFPDMPLPQAMESFDYSNHLIIQERSYDRDALAVDAAKLRTSLAWASVLSHKVLLLGLQIFCAL